MLNIILWISQILLALICLGSGFFKTFYPEKKLVESGQTGVEGLDPRLIKFIGISEILIAAGLILPWLLNVLPWLTPVAAGSFGIIMMLAARIHYKRFRSLQVKKERQNVINNFIILTLCIFVWVGRTWSV
jgi:hypothetical protein